MADGEWWRHGVLYQVYPRSFADSDGDGVGDLRGITARLGHLADLGVDGVWLSPFYPSPGVDFGYDVSDHTAVDPLLGTLADADALLAEAHRLGLRVLVDLVPNHTSDQHPWFLASRSSRDDPKRDWYVWADPAPGGGPPNNWISSFPAVGPAWTLDAATGQYYGHAFTPQQPDLNWWNPEVRDAMDGVLRFWLDRGVDGFRIDVAHRLGKDRDLADNPPELAGARKYAWHPTLRQRNLNTAEGHAILRRFRRVVDAAGPGRVLLGEAVVTRPEELARYLEPGELHLAFDFAFTYAPWDAAAVRAAVEATAAALPPGGWPTLTLSNHDIARIVSRLGRAQARTAAVLLLTLRGTPVLYYGDELGMADVEVPPELARDPDGRDPQRTPMRWSPGPGAGFTTGTPWLPVGDGADGVDIASQAADPRSMLALHRRLLALRRATPALQRGSYRPVDAPDGVYAYLREDGADRILVALGFTARSADVAVPEGAMLLLSSDPDRAGGPLPALRLGAHEGVVVRLPS